MDDFSKLNSRLEHIENMLERFLKIWERFEPLITKYEQVLQANSFMQARKAMKK